MIALGDAAQVLEHRARLHQLDPAQNPLDVPLPRWKQFLVDARAFYAEDPGWAMLAAEAVKPFARIDRAGLCWLIGGAAIEYLDETEAKLVFPSGSIQTYPRKGIARMIVKAVDHMGRPTDTWMNPPMDPTGLKAPWELA
jgi:hypothetical protein